MINHEINHDASSISERHVGRRTVLLGTVGALVAVEVGHPARSAAATTAAASPRHPRFDKVLAHQLQRVLDDTVRAPGLPFPGGILHVHGATLGTWTGVAGLGRLAPDVPMHAIDRFRAGSIAKPFVSVAVLQLVERGRLSLDARLTSVLPLSVVGRFPTAADISVRMLLSHRSGIPDWLTPAVNDEIAHHPDKIWTVAEILEIAAAQPPLFPPGTSYSYSNTNYNLLGLIIERVTGRSWRDQITRRVIDPLDLKRTTLPAPGDRFLTGAYAHGYGQVDGRTVDMTDIDPSMAGAAGGGALVTTVQDLTGFLDSLLAGHLFSKRDTLRQMLTFLPAPDGGGQVGYGLGIIQRLLPGGIEMIDHSGLTAGYSAYVGRLVGRPITVASVLNWEQDPSPLLVPAIQLLAAAHP